MFIFLTILAIIVCLFLILFILIQNPKGGGLSSNFGASNQIMGVQKTGDFLERTTWGLSIALLVICLSMKVFSPSTGKSSLPNDSPSNGSPSNATPTRSSSRPSGGAPSGSRPANSPAAVPADASPKSK